jgi:drug/metabolite transporter (DMT)-like permease
LVDGHSSPAHTRQAFATLIASAFLFGIMAVCTRIVSRRIPGPEVAMFRFAVGVLVVLAAWAAGRATLRPKRWGWLLLRGIFGGTAVFLYFSCIEHVGAGLATLLNYTAPVWSLLFGWWLLGERPRPSAAVALVLTLAGVACVVGGTLRGVHNAWTLAGVFSAFASGVAITSIRAVRRAGPAGSESSWTVFASFTAFGLLTTLPGVLGPFGRWVTPTVGEGALVGFVAVISVAAQLMMTRALAHVTGATVGIVHQLTVIVALVCGVLFLGEHLTRWSLLGSVLTVSGVAWTVLTASRPSAAVQA